MVMKYDSRSCAVTTNWEWGQNSGSGGSKDVSVSDIAVSAYQDFGWDGGDWSPSGSLVVTTTSHSYSDSDGYTGNIPLQSHNATVNAPTFSGTYIGQTSRQYGGGTGTFSGTVYQTASYSWGATSSSHNHDSSISYDDGTYAGTLTLDSCNGTGNYPSSSGSYVGQTTTTNGTGTAYYSGDVPLKGSSGGGGSRPSNWTWTTLSSSGMTYDYGGVLRADICTSTEWNSFCNHINLFRHYKNLPNYNFSTAVSKTSLTSSHYEEARLAISEMITTPTSVSTGETGVNSKLIALSNALNNVT